MWLFGSLIAGGVASAIATSSASSAVAECASEQSYYGYAACTPDYSTTQATLVIAGIAAVIWLIIRLVVVSNQAKALTSLAAGVVGGQPAPAHQANINPIQIQGLAILLFALVFMLWITVGFVLFDTGAFIAGAYLLMMRRLSQVSWGRATLETSALMLSVAVLLWVVSAFMYRGYVDGGQFLLTLAIAVISSLVAAAVAQWSAPWSSIRAVQIARAKSHFILYAALVTLGVLALTIYPAFLPFHPAFLPIYEVYEFGSVQSLVAGITIIVMAIVETFRLKRLIASAP